MNDPHWRGHDGKPDTLASRSPGIPILTDNPNLDQYGARTWPIAPYSDIDHLDKIKEGVFGICRRHSKIFKEEHTTEWEGLLGNAPSAGAVSSEHQAEWYEKVQCNCAQWPHIMLV
jgi:hypothetical protein